MFTQLTLQRHCHYITCHTNTCNNILWNTIMGCEVLDDTSFHWLH